MGVAPPPTRREELAEFLRHLRLQRVQRAFLHRQDQRVDVGEHIVDRADGAADRGGEIARLERLVAIDGGDPERLAEQRLAQFGAGGGGNVNHIGSVLNAVQKSA